jgi:hypothetical protein
MTLEEVIQSRLKSHEEGAVLKMEGCTLRVRSVVDGRVETVGIVLPIGR